MIIRNDQDLQNLRFGGKINKKILSETLGIIKPGISTMDIENFVIGRMKEFKVTPSFLNYNAGDGPYPFYTCVSINHQLVHTLPSDTAIIKEGDLVTVDMGVKYNGLHTDTAFTIEAGDTNKHFEFLKAGQKGLENALKRAVVGNRLGDVSYEMQKAVESAGFNVSRDLVGHGIGNKLHEPPQVLCYGRRGTGEALVKNQVLAIEVMYMEKDTRLVVGDDGFSLDTYDRGLSAQFEHTVVVKSGNCEILV